MGFEELAGMPLRPLTRIRYTAAAVERAEEALHRARLTHVDAIVAAHEASHSLGEIGKALGITRQRVHALIVWRRKQRKESK